MRSDNAIVLRKRTYGRLVGGVEQWYAFYEGPHSKRIEDAFGTCVVPTAFTGSASADRVLKAISALNPGIRVEVEVESQ